MKRKTTTNAKQPSNSEFAWRSKVDAVIAEALSEHDRALLERSFNGDSNEIRARIIATQVENQLDEIGLQAAPRDLQNRLYAIADSRETTNTRSLRPHWYAGLAAAATVVLAVFVGLQMDTGAVGEQPSQQALAQAQAELQLTFHYLNKATQLSRQHMQATVTKSMQTAIDKSLEPVNDDITEL